jgi:hypothetical protein
MIRHSVDGSGAFDATDWLTTEQVIERLLADPELRKHASTCVLPGVRCGDEWRFRKSDLDQWILGQRRLGGR